MSTKKVSEVSNYRILGTCQEDLEKAINLVKEKGFELISSNPKQVCTSHGFEATITADSDTILKLLTECGIALRRCGHPKWC